MKQAPLSDYDLLRAVYQRLDKDGLLAKHPGLTRRRLDEFFKKWAGMVGDRGSNVRLSRRLTILHTDGGSKGNPGPAGYGVVLLDGSRRVMAQESGFIGRATSNQAEYRGLLRGLELARERGADNLLIRSDSLLLVSQLNGRYKVKSQRLLPLFLHARRLLDTFRSWRVEHVPREANVLADRLASEAIREHKDTPS